MRKCPHLYKQNGAWIVSYRPDDVIPRLFMFNTFRLACDFARTLS